MLFKGYSKTFSVLNNIQYELIGEFWDYMSEKFGMENLKGLGFNWNNNTIEYVIGLKNKDIDNNLNMDGSIYKEINLPDNGWTKYNGKTEQLPEIYKEIYKDGTLLYEIETFDNNGNCEIMIYR